jgi:photosystem I P700 chlorophyll a apoprotein A1
MAISSSERRIKNVQILVEKDAVETNFAKWAQPGHFSRTLAKGPQTTTWIWNLHADVHDFDIQTNSLEQVSRKFFYGLVECISMEHIFQIILLG